VSARWAGLLFWAAACRTASPQDTAAGRAEAVLEQPWERRGDLVLSCQPHDAEVDVDGVPRGLCSDFSQGRGIQLGRGMHHVEVRKAGFTPYETYCEPGGTQETVAVSLQPEGHQKE
jgi:hypothetical protein